MFGGLAVSRFVRIVACAASVAAVSLIPTSAMAQSGKAAVSLPFVFRSTDVAPNGTMTLTQVYDGFGCTGQNVSPALQWSGVPAGTKSLAITVYDPDAPTGSGWWHWMVYDIPPTTTSLPAGVGARGKAPLPAGALLGMTDFGAKGWGGPCPPVGDKPHRYIFTIFALKVAKLEVPATATSALIGYNLNGNTLGKASFTALYGR
jgi:Raf kinase inhibitor-like YbhB/YbcL family protein